MNETGGEHGRIPENMPDMRKGILGHVGLGIQAGTQRTYKKVLLQLSVHTETGREKDGKWKRSGDRDINVLCKRSGAERRGRFS